MGLSQYLIPAALGLAAHHGVFIHGEWHLQAAAVFSLHLLSIAATIGTQINHNGTRDGLLNGAAMVACYCGTLFGSIVIYRLFFHRLRHFPGPRMMAITKLTHVWQCRDSRNHLVLEELHQKYGPYVRTGPKEITVFTAGAFDAMDGPKSNTNRSDWYDLLYPRVSSVFTRDKALHDSRRRIWSHSLSTAALASYEPRILRKVAGLKRRIELSKNAPILVNDLMRWFSFDLMGDFAFSKDFGMMEKQKYNDAISQLRRAITLLGPFSHAIWIIRLGFSLAPGLWKIKDWFGMLAFCDSCMEQRMTMEIKERDIASWFIEVAEQNQGNKDHERWLSGDTATVVVAGSDTTAPSLTALFYFLALNPKDAEIIHKEASSVNLQDARAVAELPHLNGAINEAMRLLPAVLTFVTRDSPPEGMMIDGTYIPGDIKIAAPRYSIGRLASSWEDPHTFRPERWYSRPEMIRDKRAFAPFGVGRTSCVGKPLALSEIRLATAHVLASYRVKFAPGDRGEAVERDMRDQLTANPGDLNLIFEPRESPGGPVRTRMTYDAKCVYT